MPHENHFGKGVLIGFLAVGALGAALALLYAPKSGRELRQDIKNKTDDYLDEAEKYIAEAKDKAIDLAIRALKEGEKKLASKAVDLVVIESGLYKEYTTAELKELLKKYV